MEEQTFSLQIQNSFYHYFSRLNFEFELIARFNLTNSTGVIHHNEFCSCAI
jgi:hypothetical protein